MFSTATLLQALPPVSSVPAITLVTAVTEEEKKTEPTDLATIDAKVKPLIPASEIKIQVNLSYPSLRATISTGFWKHDEHEIPVVIKQLLPQVKDNPIMLKEMKNEGTNLAALQHIPSVIRFHGFVGDDAIVLDSMPGGNAHEWINQQFDTQCKTFPTTTRYKLIEDVASIVAELHESKYIHGDLKWENFLMKGNKSYTTYQGITIIDFGASHKFDNADKPLALNGESAGTPGYSAPEVRRGHICPASDVFSLAIMMYTLFEGMHFPKLDFPNKQSNLTWGLRPSITSFTPQDFAKLITQCWNQDPQLRPNMKTVRDRMHALRITTEIESQPEQSDAQVNPTAPSNKR